MSFCRLSLIREVAGGASLLAFSVAAHSFEAVDQLTPSTSGRFAAYADQAVAPALSEFWVQGGAMVDDNILRRTEAPPTETVLRLGAGGRKDTYVYGRQMVRLEGRVDGYLFNKFSELDNLSYGGLAEWHWALGNDLDGVLGASQRRYQRNLAYIQNPTRDLITETHYTASGAYRLGPSFRLRGAGDLASYKDPLFFGGSEVQSTTGTVGVDYVTALGNTLGVEYRQGRGDAPVPTTSDPTGAFGNNTYRERTLALAAGYVSPFFRLAGNVGRTKRTYSEIPGHDFEGGTWRATADWLVTPKTALGLETYYQPYSLLLLTTSHVVVRGVAFGPGWAPTAKLNFSARVMRERQEYALEPTAPPGTIAELDILRTVRLGAYWEYTRQIHWTFAIDHGERDSNVLGRDFRYHAVMANVRYLFW